NGRVNISNINGSITISAWDRNEVKLEYVKVADLKERLADVEVRISAKADFFSVETDYGNWKGKDSGDRWRNNGKLNVEFKLMVPRGAFLNEIETVNGSVHVSNFINVTKVSAVNGTVNAVNIRGTANLSTVNGEVVADFDRLETGSRITLDTVNGRVNLIIPSDSNATLKADSLNGNITNDFGLPVRKGKYIGRDLYGRLGNGEVQIKLSSVNGGITIARKRDGRNQNPAVNLLPQKEKGDEWDDGGDTFSSVKVDKEVAKAVKESSKAASKAMADAEKEMSKIKPEFAKVVADSVAAAVGVVAQTTQLLVTDEMQQRMRDVQTVQRDTMARMPDNGFFQSLPRVERISESFPVKGIPTIMVMATGCSVSIKGSDTSEVQYRITQFADSRIKTPLNITKDNSDSTVTLTVENKDFRNGRFFDGSNRVRVEILVPRKSNLKISSDGEIRIEGVSGEVELQGSDESINVRDVDGKLNIQNSDGRIRVIGFNGDIVATSADGSINLEGDFKSLNARASEGPITITLPDNVSADIEANRTVVSSECIELNKLSGGESSSKYRIGKGGPLYQLKTDGEILVRGAGIFKENY
ncbi:MAG: DUF4097 family beta strand repeat-containing protein, partial [Pyrinomonadaceae bacterium]